LLFVNSFLVKNYIFGKSIVKSFYL
jgi:hypothetical protein